MLGLLLLLLRLLLLLLLLLLVAVVLLVRLLVFSAAGCCVVSPVHESQYDEMVGELAKQADGAKAVMGDGMEKGTMFGPINNKMQFERVAGLVDDARKEGGTIVTGGKQMGPEDGYFCESSNGRGPQPPEPRGRLTQSVAADRRADHHR